MFPLNSEDYLKYRLFQFPENIEDNKNNLLVLNEEEKIVGCTLFFPTKAKMYGKVEKVFWSHDTIIDPAYKKAGDAGMLLIAECMQMKNVFGYSVSALNYKIHKKIKASFIGETYKINLFSCWSYKLLFYKLKLLKPDSLTEINCPEVIQIKEYKFLKIKNVDQLNIPNHGYWNPNLDLDFVRDVHFLKNRFFENHKKYVFYKLISSKVDECYFVLGLDVYKGVLLLDIVDFRFNMERKFQYKIILKAVSKILTINKLPIAVVRTNFPHRKISLFPLMIKMNPPSHCITYNRIKENISFFITFGDSDADYDFRIKKSNKNYLIEAFIK